MDLLHSWGVELAVHLQTKYSRYEDIFSVASSVADLHTTFFFFFPIWFHLRRDTGLRLIWVAVLGDWLNLVLKWYDRGGGGSHSNVGDVACILSFSVSPQQGSVRGEAVLVGQRDPVLWRGTGPCPAAVSHHM